MMTKIFRSRVDLLLFWPYLVYLVLVLILTLVSGSWYMLPLLGMPVGVILAQYFSTSYTISDNGRLEIVSHRVPGRKKVIDIRSITAVDAKRNSLPAPALSKERLHICFSPSEEIYISPSESEDFVALVQAVNPRILVV
ncbi:PH domain-containing protein [Dyadobacter sp. 32]|uniref:PH domain-containing protein n=1 Tax=Dyadobacter sp. 32 TaxID=538966 RepID=UPI0011ECF5E6